MLIRWLDPSEAPLVGQFYRDAPDYWLLAEGAFDPDLKAQELFTDAPPSCDPEQSHHLGLMLIGPWAQCMGHGRIFLHHAETLARSCAASRIYLAVLEANPRGRAFWEREGFTSTDRTVVDSDTGHCLHRLMKPL